MGGGGGGGFQISPELPFVNTSSSISSLVLIFLLVASKLQSSHFHILPELKHRTEQRAVDFLCASYVCPTARLRGLPVARQAYLSATSEASPTQPSWPQALIGIVKDSLIPKMIL